MTCTPLDNNGSFACSAPWGLGVYADPNETEDGPMYGMSSPAWMNPFWFHPDGECTTKGEYAAWKKAKEEWTGVR